MRVGFDALGHHSEPQALGQGEDRSGDLRARLLQGDIGNERAIDLHSIDGVAVKIRE